MGRTESGNSRTFLYFAYGSNMSSKRLLSRTPSARVIGPAILRHYRLAFHKVGMDGSAKCDIVQAEDAQVMGVLFEIELDDKPELDRVEGLGEGYDAATVEVESRGAAERALTYVATERDSLLKPYTWYKRHVLEGAKEANLPRKYIDDIRAVVAQVDADKTREARELAIYREYKGSATAD